jgi:hypothetical protein
MVVTVNAEKVVKHAQTSIDYQAHGKSIDQRWAISSASGQPSWPDKYLVGLMAEMHEKWPMATSYF